MEDVEIFYREATVYVRMEGGFSASVGVKGGVRQGCWMSPMLFNMKEMKTLVGNVCARLKLNGADWEVVT